MKQTKTRWEKQRNQNNNNKNKERTKRTPPDPSNVPSIQSKIINQNQPIKPEPNQGFKAALAIAAHSHNSKSKDTTTITPSTPSTPPHHHTINRRSHQSTLEGTGATDRPSALLTVSSVEARLEARPRPRPAFSPSPGLSLLDDMTRFGARATDERRDVVRGSLGSAD